MRATRAEINVTALQFNIQQIKKKVGTDVKVMGVVKANAYGHGLDIIARKLSEFGIDYLAVAYLEEAVFLRQQGIKIPILVFNTISKKEIPLVTEHDIDITILTVENALELETELEKNNKRVRVHVKIDTGMGRLGVRVENAIPFIQHVIASPRLNVVGLYSHFATSDSSDKSFARYQLKQFNAILEKLEENKIEIQYKHIANSGAIINIPQSYFSMVRPGIMMYGVYPSPEMTHTIELHPVLSLKSSVSFIKRIPAGTSISYGRKYFSQEDTIIATIPIGYADGYDRGLTNIGEVLIKERFYRIAGTICMDQLMVNLGSHSEIKIGDEVTIIGGEDNKLITAWDIAEKICTISYEVLTGISARVPRVIIENGKNNTNA